MSIGASSFRKLVGAAAVAGVVCVGTVSAQINMSAGIQGAFRNNFGGGVESQYCEPGYGCESWEEKLNWVGGGFNAFFDATYVMATLGMTISGHSEEDSWREGSEWGSGEFSLSMTSFDIGVFGKYPIDLGTMTLFPMAGFEYRIVLSGSYTEEGRGYDEWEGSYSYKYEADLGKYGLPKAGDFSRLWFKFGGGLDVPLSDAMFLRASAMYGIGLANKVENDWGDDYGPGYSADPIFSHGFDIRVGVGFRF